MSDTILIGTRKGLFAARRNGTWRAAPLAFPGIPVSALLRAGAGGPLYAALSHGHFGAKLHRSDDGGRTWTELAMPAFPEGTGRSVQMVWSLAAGTAGSGELWAGTLPGGLFRSADGGESWSFIEPLWNAPRRDEWMGGGYDDPGIHSICVDPRDPRVVRIAVSTGGVWASRDGGASWEVKGRGLRAAYLPPASAHDPVLQDAHRLVQCPTAPDALWIQHHNGIFRSTDGGDSWTEIEAEAPSRFGFAVAVHPGNGDTAWFVPATSDEHRYAVEGRLVVTRTRDGGASFEVLTDGLPAAGAWDLVYRHALDVDATGDRLAFGSTTGGVWITENGGDRWSALPERLPPVNVVQFI